MDRSTPCGRGAFRLFGPAATGLAIGAHLDRIAKIDFGPTPTFRMPGKSFSRRTTLRAPEASGALRSTPTSLALRSFPCRRSKAESPAARAIFRKGWRAQRGFNLARLFGRDPCPPAGPVLATRDAVAFLASEPLPDGRRRNGSRAGHGERCFAGLTAPDNQGSHAVETRHIERRTPTSMRAHSLPRLQERAACRALLGPSVRGCGRFPARNCWTARGRFSAASGQNARTPSFPGGTRFRVSRICSRPTPNRRLENDHPPPLFSSQIPLDRLEREDARLALPSRFRAAASPSICPF